MLKKEKAATKFSKVSFREMAMQSNRLQKKEMKTLLLEGPMMNDDSWEGCSFILRMNVVARRIDFCLRYPCLFSGRSHNWVVSVKARCFRSIVALVNM